MYYDTYRGKRSGKKRRERGCTGWLLGMLLKLIALMLVAVVLAAGVLFAIPPSFMNIEPGNAELSLTDGLPGERVNILLLGIDFLEDGQQRSDAMMIASVGYNSVRLVSVLRDTLVEIPGYGEHKLNSAYSYGGAEMAMRVVNETFKLNITNYIAVDFSTMVDLVDAIGGVDVEVEDKELEHLNKYAYDTFKKINAVNPEKYGHYINSQPYTQGGNLHLNGLFATGYSRIRLIDSDYARTLRQRRVLSAILEQVKGSAWNPLMYARLYQVYRDSVQTNLSLAELISIGEKALVAGKIETERMPKIEYIYDDQSALHITDPQGNIIAMHDFLYGE
ncbi:MAG: LCP family protein [Clostridia bacterium]|nr:LCP family protein [Clostridia bacterium]